MLNVEERKRLESLVGTFIEKRRPRPELREKLDFGFRITGQSVVLFEIRPRFDHPEQKIEHAVAKATYVQSRGYWRLYWQRANLKWERYHPYILQSVDAFLRLIAEDKHGCFWE